MTGGRNLWTRAETVLALDVARRVGAASGPGDPLVAELSRLLRDARDAAEPRDRNAFGVACKVARLAILLDGGEAVGGAQLEHLVCDEFRHRPRALADAVAWARRSLAVAVAESPSVGPVPAFGELATSRDDGPTMVYLARLTGVALTDGRMLAKVGRSADVGRRMGELNVGLPAPLGVSWRPVATWRFDCADAAHDAEQSMLASCAAAGLSVGGEFVAVTAEGLASIAAAGPLLSAGSARPRSPSAPYRRGWRGARRRGRARRRG